MKARVIVRLVLAVVLTSESSVLAAQPKGREQESLSSATPAGTTGTGPSTTVPNASAPDEARQPESVSTAVAEIVKMSKAGVDAGVIQAYVEHSGHAVSPSAEEVIYLREQGLSREIIASLIRRGSTLRAQAIEATAQADRVRAAQWAAAATAANKQSEAAVVYTPAPQVVQPVYVYNPPRLVTYPAYRYSYFNSFAPGFSHGYCPPASYRYYSPRAYWHGPRAGFGSSRFYGPGFRFGIACMR